MAITKTGLYPARRLETGAAILAAAEVNDVKLIRRRLEAFAASNRAYADAQKGVEAATAELQTQQATVSGRTVVLDAAMETMAAALALEGQPRRNPFAAYGSMAPSAIKLLNWGRKAKAIHVLVGSVQAQTKLGIATRRAVEDAEAAARALEKEVAPLYTLRAGLKMARAALKAAGKAWDTSVAALKLDARAAAADGAPGLYRALFGSKRSQKPAASTPDVAPPVTLPQPLQAATAAESEVLGTKT